MANSCTDSLPDFSGALNYCSPGYVFGEIEEIILTPLEVESGNPYPTDWRDTSDWDDILTAPTGSTPIGYKLPVIGSIDEPDRPEINTSLYRIAYPPKRWNLPLMMDDLSDKVYDNLRSMANKTLRMWFISGGYLFGGEQGLIVDIDTWPVIEEGEDSIHKYHIHATWRDRYSPKRTPSPFAASLSGTATTTPAP